MDKPTINNIRKIIFGTNPKDGMAIETGHVYNTPHGKIVVESIIRDENAFYYFGNVVYQIYAKTEKGVLFVWKTSENVPVMIESMIPN